MQRRISVPTIVLTVALACLVVGSVSFYGNPFLCIVAWGAFLVLAFTTDTLVQYRSVVTAVIVAIVLMLAMMLMAWSGFSYVFDSRQLTIVSAALILGLVLKLAMRVLFVKAQPAPLIGA